MAYKKCRECEFWVSEQPETFCANCGIFEPFIAKDVVDKIDAFTDPQGCAMLVLMAVGAIIGGYFGIRLNALWAIGLFLLVPSLVFIACAIVFGLWNDEKKEPFNRKAEESLKKDEDLVNQRLQELTEQEKGLETARQQITQEAASSGWDQVSEALAEAAAGLPEKRKQYQVKLWAIELVRWHNSLEPLRDDWDNMTSAECNRRIEAARTARAKGETLLKSWEAEAQLIDLPEAQVTLARLRDTLTACNQLLQALIAKQAILAMKSGDGLKLGMTALPESILPDAIDLFNARVAINEFSMTLKELETEYARQAPAEAGKTEKGKRKKEKG